MTTPTIRPLTNKAIESVEVRHHTHGFVVDITRIQQYPPSGDRKYNTRVWFYHTYRDPSGKVLDRLVQWILKNAPTPYMVSTYVSKDQPFSSLTVRYEFDPHFIPYTTLEEFTSSRDEMESEVDEYGRSDAEFDSIHDHPWNPE